MLKLSEINKTLRVVNCQKGSPTSTVDLDKVIIKLIEDKSNGFSHCTCKGEGTWYEFTKEIFRLKGIDTEVLPCTTDEFQRSEKDPNIQCIETICWN